MPDKAKNNEKVIEELEYMFQFVSPKELSRNIIEAYFIHVFEYKGSYSDKFRRLTANVYFLLKFLETADDELGETAES